MAMKFNFQQLTNQQKQILAIGAVIAVALSYSYYKYIWTPWSQKIALALQQTQAVQEKINAAKQEAKHLEVLEKELDSLSVRALDAEKRLPRTRDMPTVFDTVNRLAQKYKVQLTNFAPGTMGTRTYFIEIPYQISLQGRYHDVGRFLASIAVEERIYNVNNVTFSPGGSVDDKNKLNVTFTLVAYQYKG